MLRKVCDRIFGGLDPKLADQLVIVVEELGDDRDRLGICVDGGAFASSLLLRVRNFATLAMLSNVAVDELPSALADWISQVYDANERVGGASAMTQNAAVTLTIQAYR